MNETTTPWIKAAASDGGGQCAEFRRNGGGIELRNSRFPDTVLPPFTRGEIAALVTGARAGDFDQLLADD